jgi:hypothetical protein
VRAPVDAARGADVPDDPQGWQGVGSPDRLDAIVWALSAGQVGAGRRLVQLLTGARDTRSSIQFPPLSCLGASWTPAG